MNHELQAVMDGRMVAQGLAGGLPQRQALVCYCQATYEVKIFRALRRNEPYFREFARDAFQDLCCVLLDNPRAVLDRFPTSRRSLKGYLTRWARRRMHELIHRRERLAQYLPPESVPEPVDPASVAAVQEGVRWLWEKAHQALRFLTAQQRRLVAAILEGKFAEFLEQTKLTQGALRVMLHRMRRRLQAAGAV